MKWFVTEHDHPEIEKVERWAVMEWILVGQRLWLLVALLIAVAAASGIGIFYAEAVGHLNADSSIRS